MRRRIANIKWTKQSLSRAIKKAEKGLRQSKDNLVDAEIWLDDAEINFQETLLAFDARKKFLRCLKRKLSKQIKEGEHKTFKI